MRGIYSIFKMIKMINSKPKLQPNIFMHIFFSIRMIIDIAYKETIFGLKYTLS